MENLVFVTGNRGKMLDAKNQFSAFEVNLDWFEYDGKEPNVNDIEYISKFKANQAYRLTGKPCFVIDTGFYIENYPGEPGFPGAFVRRAIVNQGVSDLLEKMQGIVNRHCQFIDCLTYYDGIQFKTFFGVSHGSLSYEKKGRSNVRAKSDLWYVYIPNNHDKTLAEMTDEERDNREDGHTCAIKEFLKWYTKNGAERNGVARYED